MTALWLSLATVLSTMAGGLCALRLRARLHLLLGFAAGVLLGVVAFELWPESLQQAHRTGGSGHGVLLAAIAGFVLLHGLRRFALYRHRHGVPRDTPHDAAPGELRARAAGVVAALPLVGHSVVDGVGIGLAVQVSPAVGIAVAIAVIAHDFCDGLNTVSLMLRHRHPARGALRMLALDAVAPLLGAAATLAFDLPVHWVAPYLGCFAGSLLYIGATDLLPAAYAHARPATVLQLAGLNVIGALLMYGLARWPV